MIVKKAVVGPLNNNTYLVVTNENNGILIDPGCDLNRIDNMIKEEDVNLKYIFLTHGHFDHIATAKDFIKKYNAKLVVSKNDAEMICDETKCLAYMFTRNFSPLKADIEISDGDEIAVDELLFRFIETKGHSKGSVCIVCGDTVFTGDTILEHSVGRTDFYGGDAKEMMLSLRKIKEFPDDFKLLCGHGEQTTVKTEKAVNVYLKNA